MQLLIVRHAVAEPRETFARTGEDDAARPLTAAGRRKFAKGARGLRGLVESVDVLATSPLVRAMETAEILAREYRGRRPVLRRELAPDATPSEVLAWLRRRRRTAVVAVVGHEPHLSRLVGYLLGVRRGGLVRLEKGGACLLDLGEEPAPGRAQLAWLLGAGQLRRLRR